MNNEIGKRAISKEIFDAIIDIMDSEGISKIDTYWHNGKKYFRCEMAKNKQWGKIHRVDEPKTDKYGNKLDYN